MLRISEFILSFVLNATWQIVAITAAAAFGSLLLKNSPARFRYTLWVFALVACFVAPLFTATGLIPESLPSLRSVQKRLTVSSVTGTAPTLSPSVIKESGFDLVSRRRQEINTTPNMGLFLSFAIAIYIAGRGIRLARFWRRKERLRRSATLTTLVPDAEIVAERCRRLLKTGAVRVMRSSEARVPYTLGALSPLIVLPEPLFAAADENKLLSVIGHEMAHVKRRDFLSNLFCELLVLPVSFHPLSFLIKRQIDRDRELACDELVKQRPVRWVNCETSAHSSS